MITIAWNVVNLNFHANESLLTHLRQKITELEPYLGGFAQDTAHLLIELRRDLKTDTYTAALSLRLADNILRSEQSAKYVKQAFDEALKGLVSQLKSQKSAAGQQQARFSDQPMAEGTGPQNYEELTRQHQNVHA
ncbi:MAG TPA: HPF/RaiA family ribosome-associated protein [Verrucomicrobiae bacterium]|nr:HPF/RaiA family ribosome-associated protein [Verrucomicrobiae bacterium]